MNNQRRIGIVLSYVSEAIQVITGLLYTPIMLRLLGQNEYGLYQLVASVISYLSLFSLGFSGAYVKFYSRYKVQNDKKNIAKLNGMFIVIFGIISLIATICGIFLAFNISSILGDGLTYNELTKARILMIIMTFNLALTFIGTVFSCIVTAHEEFVFQKGLLIIKEICNPFITLPLLLLGYGSIGMVTVSTILSIISLTVNSLFCIRKLNIKFDFHKFNFGLFKEMWIFTFFIFLNQVIDQINWNVDKFLLGKLRGTATVAVYGVASQINTMYLRFSTSISNVFTPKINIMVAGKDNNNSLTNMMIKVGRIQYEVLMLVLSGFLLFGKNFINLWAGEGYEEAYYITLLLIIPVTVPLIQNLGIDIQRALNKHKMRSIIYFLIAILNIFISIPLIKIWGASGAALGTAFGLFVGNIAFMNIYYHKALGLNMYTFWKEILLVSKGIIIPIIIGFFINYVIHKVSITWLLIKIIVYTLIYVISMWKFGLNEYEKSIFIKPMNKIFKTNERNSIN